MVVVKDNISIIVPVLSLEGLVPGPGLGLEGLILGPGLEAYDVLANVTAQMSYFVSSATQNPDLQFALHQHERRQTQKTRHDENKQLFSLSLALSAWLLGCCCFDRPTAGSPRPPASGANTRRDVAAKTSGPPGTRPGQI